MSPSSRTALWAGLLAMACERKLEPEGDDAETTAGEAIGSDSGSGGTTDGEDADGDGFAGADDCDDTDPTVTGPTEWFADLDEDGFAGDAESVDACLPPLHHYATPTDCDDTNSAIHPDAPEVCNGIDDNCDERVDLDDAALDLSTVEPRFPDRDADGYGDPAGEYEGCATDAGTVDNGDDCDDTNAALTPDTLWYADTDDDGYGNPDDSVAQCEAPIGRTRDANDCDDRDETVHPGVVEVCDGKDNDCDGLVDDDDLGLDATTATSFYPDNDADGFGDTSREALFCAAPSGWVAVDGDCDDAESEVHPDALDECGDGIDNDCDGAVPVVCGGGQLDADELDAAILGESYNDRAGRSIAVAGDVDGDGLDDVLVGAPGNADAGVNAGKAYFVGGATLSSGVGLASATGWTGEAVGDALGEKVAAAGDVDGDGYDDLLLGAKDADDPDTNARRAYLVNGGTSLASVSPSGTASVSTADASWTGLDDNDSLGHGLAPAGDHDGDGFADFLLGAPENDDGVANGGAVYLVYGSSSLASGRQTPANLPVFYGAATSDYLGHWFGLGHVDLDGDGLDDLALGAYRADGSASDTGAVYVFNGTTRRSGSASADDAPLTITGTSYSGGDSYFGYAISDRPGDINADGYDDLVVGAYYFDQAATNAGALFVFYGSTSAFDADLDAEDADTRLLGSSAYDYCGKDVSVLPDVNGDGADDLLLGCYGEDSGGYTAGATYLVLGDALSGTQWMPSDALFWMSGAASGDSFGHSVAGGDVDGDGLGDLLVGAPDAGPSGEGTLYLLHGMEGFGNGG